MELATFNVTAAMSEAVSEVFESMAFLVAQPGEAEHAPEKGVAAFYTRLPIYKPTPAMIGLVVTQEMALEWAGAMMMRDFNMEDDEFEVMDVLSELANTLGGSLLTNLMPDGCSFELGLPECRHIGDIVADKEWENSQEFLFQIGNKGFYLTWEAS
ncbi:MAG: chemotaxis protein CheX [bacterium]|nr:chemotaxis protein CheX [bacterium]